MISCDICGKQFKNTQGLRGHRHFVHSDNSDSIGHPAAQQAGQQPLSTNVSARVMTEQRLSQLEDRTSMLEHNTGVRETDEIEKMIGMSCIPLNERVAQLTEQLSKLTEQLKSEYVSKENLETVVAELTGAAESLHKEIAETYDMLTTAIRENRKAYEIGLSKMEGKLTTVSNELHELRKDMKQVQESVQHNRDSINQLNTGFISLERGFSGLDNKATRLEILARRVPTGEIVSIELSDKREHHFREYKSKEGLARPYRNKIDLIMGSCWIDLAEPED